MVLWWIGNVILLLVVVPVLVALLNRVLAALERIRGASDDILAGGVALIGELDDVPELLADDRQHHRRGRGRRGPLRRLRRQAARLRGRTPPCLPSPGSPWSSPSLIIAAAALGLVRVILHLHGHPQDAAATLVGGVRVVAEQDQHGARGRCRR